jgi:hypothetical protein
LIASACSSTVYKNDERLGVMATGLSGEYSWAGSLYGLDQSSMRIEDTAVLPASPTPHELAQAVAWAGFESDEGSSDSDDMDYY